jgi:pSer/pThr/pTyr-binding forkhead associated (FHA) protein
MPDFPPASARPEITMKAKLIALDNHGPEVPLVLDKLPVVLGRNPDADVRLDDRWISRVHCEISEINGTLVVRDLDSRNGTLVNGESIKEAHLLPGDRLTVGLTSFKVEYNRSPRSSSAYASSSVERGDDKMARSYDEAGGQRPGEPRKNPVARNEAKRRGRNREEANSLNVPSLAFFCKDFL